MARFSGVNLVVHDMHESLLFYRRLGVDIPEGAVWSTHSGAHHAVAAHAEGAAELQFESYKLAHAYNAGFAAERGRAVIAIALESRDAVDLAWANMVAEGAQGLQPPFDAPWGARYALIEDPDGNPVGLMSPVDPATRGPMYDI
ncbi:MAG TPA: VOC family protein [Caulobacteraceae bacterium]|nr:VOC family protein [Caulobacteraceae bacterium]